MRDLVWFVACVARGMAEDIARGARSIVHEPEGRAALAAFCGVWALVELMAVYYSYIA